MFNARATAWPRSKGLLVVWPWYPSDPAWVSVLRVPDDPCSHLDSPVPESLYATPPRVPLPHSHSIVPLCGTILQCPRNLTCNQGSLTSPWCQALCWPTLDPQPGPALEELSRFRWRWRCDNPGGQRRDTAPGHIWHCRKHGPTWRPGDGCLELSELTGKMGRELQADRKNAERATPWEQAGWARGRQFTSFDLSRAQGTGQEGKAAAGGRIERAPPGGPECRASSPAVSPGQQGGPERI